MFRIKNSIMVSGNIYIQSDIFLILLDSSFAPLRPLSSCISF